MKQIGVVGSVGLPACYGGFETLVERLVECEEVNWIVYCDGIEYQPNQRVGRYKNAQLTYLPLRANGWQSIFYDILSMIISVVKRHDAILILGVSGCIFLPLLRLIYRRKIIVNVDGVEWKRAKWNRYARVFLKFSELVAIKFSNTVIADNEGIRDYLTVTYGVDSTVIAYGGDHAISDVPIVSGDYALSVCRIEPENNIEMILEAFKVSGRLIRFIGNWKASRYGLELFERYGDIKNIQLLDPIYDLNRLEVYRAECLCYIHGHSAGGTNPSLVEIMHFGKCVICFDCNFNRYTTNENALYFSSSEELVGILSEVGLGNFSSIGEKMKSLSESSYRWSVIQSKYIDLFRE